jgi:AcrR family transcriptional regulator
VTDPRIERTRHHVLETARQMLATHGTEPLTFTTLAARARVSRRTLYTHWGSIEKVISDAVTLRASEKPVDLSALEPRDRLRRFLESVRTGLGDPVTRVALASLMNRSTRDVYLQLVGPIFFAEFFDAEPASDALIDSLIDRGSQLLGLVA